MKMQEIKDDILLYEAITISFQDDEELLNEYHIVTTKILKDCTMDTYSKIIEATDMLSLKWFLLKNNNDEIIGFCVLSKINNYLYSFAVNKKYRKAEILSVWFSAIASLLQERFICGLWAKNKRAIDFLCKNGMKIFKNEDNIVQLKYN